METQAPSSPLNFIIFDPSAKWPLVDSARLHGGEWYAVYSEQRLSTMLRARPACRVVSYGWAEQQLSQSATTAVERISLADFEAALNVLPPAGWVMRPGEQSFYSCEMYRGTVSTIFVALGMRDFFRFRDSITLTHDERVARCVAFLSTEQA